LTDKKKRKPVTVSSFDLINISQVTHLSQIVGQIYGAGVSSAVKDCPLIDPGF
jgi:hypothetical protein